VAGALLGGFLVGLGGAPRVRGRALLIAEQNLPGDNVDSEEQAERSGLPDLVIHDGATWAVVVESKVQAALSDDQLRRHDRTLRRRGFGQVELVVLAKNGVRSPRARTRTWSALYEWLAAAGKSEWAERLRGYLRAAEVRLVREGYLTEGTLTMFDGFRFSADNPFTYGEGKRLLKLAMAELRRDPRLKALGADQAGEGRGAITGRGGEPVWEFLPLTYGPKTGGFTTYPHLTLGVHGDHLDVAVTVPNGTIPAVRRRLAALGAEGLVALNNQIIGRARRLVAMGALVEVYAVQRHYRSQRAPETVDANVTFNIQTSTGGNGVKRQMEWVQLFADLLRRKTANIQFGYVVRLPYGMTGLDTRKSLRLIADSWCALRPLLERVREDVR
jgi:hypothetical protein